MRVRESCWIPSPLRLLTGVLAACALAACGQDSKAQPARAVDSGVPDAQTASDSRRPKFCERAGSDFVRDSVCGADEVSIYGMADIVALLHLDPTPQRETLSPVGVPISMANYERAYAVLLGHSTALPGHVVSPINPRQMLISANTAFAFARGVQRVELASRARDRPGFNF